ncbi:MAG: pyridoxamine 5'-phosphate oxidase family protein [Armatimonadetes bacterium]|nr:pyridoxamine 5'-phosphate oxidase family protein [Armatimonadota bacterium]
MHNDDAEAQARVLMARAEAVMLSTVGPDGVPRTRAMLNLHSPRSFANLQHWLAGQEPWTVWFSTNTSSAKVAQIRAHGAASAYFCLPGEWTGLLLGGTASVVDDEAVKAAVWQPNWTMYYGEDGLASADYSVVVLRAEWAELYGGLSVRRWSIERP